jgi:hypothetical protein
VQTLPPRGIRRAARLLSWSACVALLLAANACHVWRPAALDETHDFINGRARIERADGASTIVRGPRIEGDSVVATHVKTATRVTLPRTDVRRIEVERISRGRTALAGAGLVGLYLVISAVAAAAAASAAAGIDMY